MTQETRNKIYAIAGALGIILTTTGVITQDESTTGLGFVDQGLTIAGSGITLATTVIAWIKSRPSKVTVVEVPKEQVVTVGLVNDAKPMESLVVADVKENGTVVPR